MTVAANVVLLIFLGPQISEILGRASPQTALDVANLEAPYHAPVARRRRKVSRRRGAAANLVYILGVIVIFWLVAIVGAPYLVNAFRP